MVRTKIFAAIILCLSVALLQTETAKGAVSSVAKTLEDGVPGQDTSGKGMLRIGVLQEGNVFTSEEVPRFRVYSAYTSVEWMVHNSDGALGDEGRLTIDPHVGYGLLQIAKQPAGFYTLTISSSGKSRKAGFAVLAADTGSSDAQASMFGVNTHGSSWEPELYQQAIHSLSKIGVRHIRDDNSYWDQVEKEAGKYSFAPRSEAVVQTAQNAGIDPLVLLAYSNRLYDKGETPDSDEAIEAAGKYAAAVVQHYGHAVPAVEVWNEYYGGFSTGPCKQSPECYFRLLRSVYLHVKAVSPGTLIVAPAAFKVPVDWLSALFGEGALEYLDAVSVHPYRSPGRPEGLETDLENLQALIQKYNHGKTKPIWISEQGWSTQGGHPAGVDELHQALYSVRSSVIAQSTGVERNYWYDLLNDGTDVNESEQNFGLLRRPDENADGITPKPVYVAYGVAARLLRAKKAAGTCGNDAKIRCYRFDGTHDSIRVAWTDSLKPEAATIHTTEPVEMTDVFGRRSILRPAGGLISVQLTESPVYLSGAGELHKSDVVLMEGPDMGAAAGQAVPLTLHAWDCGERSNNNHVSEVLLIEGARHPITQCVSTVVLPALSEIGTRTYVGELQTNGLTSGYVTARVDVLSDVISAHVFPSFIRKGDHVEEKLEVTLENHSSQRSESVRKIEWVYGSQSGEVNESVEVHPLSRATVRIPIENVAFFKSAIAKISVHLASGQTSTSTNVFGFSPVMRATPQLIAGKLQGLEGIPAIDLATFGSYKTVGPEDVSGKIWMTWDDSCLYIAARVSETSYVVQKNPRWLQAGDSVGIGLQPGEPGAELGRSGADWYNLYVGATGSGPTVFRESLPMDILTAAHVQVERNQKEHITSYVIALPWSSLPLIAPDHALFSAVITLNKNDGQGKPGYFSLGLKGWEQWGDGLNNFRLDQYQEMVLVQ